MRGYTDSFNLLIINRDCRLCKNRNRLVYPLTYWFVNQFSQRVKYMLKFCLYNVGYQSISFGFGTHNSLRPRFDLKI